MIKEKKIIRTKWFPLGKKNTTLAAYPFIFTKEEELADNILNHERIHMRQQLETIYLCLILYAIEYIVKFLLTWNHVRAIRSVSMEQEAYLNELDWYYQDYNHHYAWVKYIFSLWPKE